MGQFELAIEKVMAKVFITSWFCITTEN